MSSDTFFYWLSLPVYMSSHEWPALQLALDELILARALQMAKDSVAGGVDWLEAGTPLIKSEGVDAIRTLKKEFPEHVIVADMKTMDTGGYEVEMAAKAGADVVCILGVADDDTIADAVRSADNYGCEVLVDLIGTEDPAKRAREVEELGAHYVGVHVGIDQQMRGHDPLDIVRDVSAAVTIPVSVAGGVNSASAPSMIAAGASIVVVGGAITKAEDIKAATIEIKKAMATGEAGTGAIRKYGKEEIRGAFLQASSCNISDAMHREGVIEGVRPMFQSIPKMVGTAVTVEALDGDWAKPVEAIDECGPGQVLVISAKPGNKAVWGELATNSCRVQKVEGVVIDGAARDADGIEKLGLPVFCSVIRPNAGDPKGHGSIGSVIDCGGQKVRTGDWIVGDSSGVVVIPKERALEIANRALDVKEKEARIRKEITDGGRTLGSVLELLKWEKIG